MSITLKGKPNIYEERFEKLIKLIRIGNMLNNVTIVPPKKEPPENGHS